MLKRGYTLYRVVKTDKERYGPYMRRIMLLVTVALAMAAMMAISAGSTFASHNAGHNPGGGGGGGGSLPAGCTRDGSQVTCVTERVFTEEETRQLSQRTEFRESPGVAPCMVGQSGRVGTQQGIETDEVLITTFGVFEVTFRETTTTVFQGNVGGQIVSGPTTETVKTGEELLSTFEEEEVVGTTFTATGKCKNVSGPQPQARG
jgi:hypothetical protein